MRLQHLIMMAKSMTAPSLLASRRKCYPSTLNCIPGFAFLISDLEPHSNKTAIFRTRQLPRLPVIIVGSQSASDELGIITGLFGLPNKTARPLSTQSGHSPAQIGSERPPLAEAEVKGWFVVAEAGSVCPLHGLPGIFGRFRRRHNWSWISIPDYSPV